MSLAPQFSFDALVETYRAAAQPTEAHPSPEHAGLAAVLAELTDEARHAIARNLERYDHRSLYEFAAAVDYITKPSKEPNS